MGQLTNLAIEKGNDFKWECDELKLTADAQKQQFDLAEKAQVEQEQEINGLEQTIE